MRHTPKQRLKRARDTSLARVPHVSIRDLNTANFPAVAPSSSCSPHVCHPLFTFRGSTVRTLLHNVALDSKEVLQTVSKRVWSQPPVSLPREKVRGREHFMLLSSATRLQVPLLRRLRNLPPKAEWVKDCASKMTVCCLTPGRALLRMYFISPAECVCVCGKWVCWMGRKQSQLRVSIFINFKVFRTPHPFAFNNTVPQSTLCVYFPGFNWARMAITLSEGNCTELSEWKSLQ